MFRWIALVVLLGCSDKNQKSPPAPAPQAPLPSATSAAPADATDTCAPFVEHLRDRLGAIAKTRPGMLPMTIPADVELATAPSGMPLDKPGVAIVMLANDMVMVGDQTVKLAEAPRLIDEYFFRSAAEAAGMDRGPKRPWPMYIWADKRVKLSSLAKLLADETLDSRSVEPRLLVAGDPAAPEDMALLERPVIKKLLAGMPKETEAAVVYRAKHMRDGGDPCMTLPMSYAKYTEAGPLMELQQAALLIPKAVEDCKCNLSDRDAFEYGVMSIVGAFHPAPHWVAVPKLAKKDTRTVADLVK